MVFLITLDLFKNVQYSKNKIIIRNKTFNCFVTSLSSISLGEYKKTIIQVPIRLNCTYMIFCERR